MNKYIYKNIYIKEFKHISQMLICSIASMILSFIIIRVVTNEITRQGVKIYKSNQRKSVCKLSLLVRFINNSLTNDLSL